MSRAWTLVLGVWTLVLGAWTLRAEVLNLIFWVLLVLTSSALLSKRYHFVQRMIWVWRGGNEFANNIEHALASENPSLALRPLLEEIRRQTYKKIYPLTDLGERYGKVVMVITDVYIKTFYRMPFLIFVLSTLGYMCSVNFVITVLGVFILFGVITLSLYMAIARIFLGVSSNYYHSTFPENLREDVEYALQKKPRHFLQDFIIHFILILVGFVYGMGFVHYSIEATFTGKDYHFQENIPQIHEASIDATLSLHQLVKRIVAFTYFSFVAITTTGFGDVYPVSTYARLMTLLEISLNVIIIIVLLLSVSLTMNIPSRSDL